MSARSAVFARIVLIILCMTALLHSVPISQAAPQSAPVTITVNTLQDVINPNDSKCSLREALQRAFDNAINNSLPNDCPQSPSGFTTIKFSVSGVILISNAVDGGQLPNIVNTVTIQGPITIDMGQASQIVLDVESSGRLNLINLTIKNSKWTALDTRGEVNIANVTFENNGAGSGGGGAIRNDGKAVIAGSKFINNRAVNPGMEGGAIRTTWDLSCAGCTFTGNTADKNGGAIALKGGRLEIADSTFTGNVVKGSLLQSAYGEGGGAIYTSASSNVYPMTIKRSTFSGNYATEGVGGAIFHSADVDLTITDSSFQGNGAGSPNALGSGGAIRNISPLTIKRSMFIANSALGDGGAISNDYDGVLTLRLVGFVGNTASVKGGAIANLNGSSSEAKISTIGASLTGNIADSQGGGIYNHDSKYDKAEFRLSVWAGNLPQNCRDQNSLDDKLPVNAVPPIDSKGQNSFGDDSCEDNDPDPSDQHNADPKLDPPAPNGGLIPGLLTQKPKPGSPLVDAVAPAAYPTDDPDVGNQDVRGLPRPMNGDGFGLPLFDIGPFELDDASPEFSSLPAAPGPIKLGTFQVGNTYTKTDALKVYNGGAADLTIGNVALAGANAADFKISGMPALLPYLGGSAVAISCTPGGNGQRTATLSFTTNDPDRATVSFNLQCTGQTPVAAGFGSTPDAPGPIGTSTDVGTNDPFFLTVRETGNAQLVLSGASLVSNPPGAITLNTLFPIAINNGGGPTNIQFTCVADSIGLRTATFSFSTNDPAHPSVSYNLNCQVNKVKEKFFPAHESTTTNLGSTAGPYGVTVSPDGKHVYVADAGDSALAAYTVDNDYTLSPLATYNSSALPAADQFATPYQVYASPDGQNVYITGVAGDSIATYARDADTGALTHLSSVKNGDSYGCFPAPCAGTVSGLNGAYGIALSPDGKFAYVSSVTGSSVVVFGRNTTTGELVDLFGGPFFRQQFTNPNLSGAYGLAVSPDGKQVYATGYTSDSLLTLKRDASTGQLSFVQVLSTTTAFGLNGVFRVIVSPDGNFVYTAAYDSDAVCTFKRSAADGKLSPSSCVSSAVYLDAGTDVALMPDGKHLLASAFNSDGVAVFERNTQSGFINFTEIISRGATLPWLDGARGVVAHPSGKAAYATGYNDDAVVTLRVGNLKPVLNTLSPASRAAGSGAFTLTVNGADFSPNSIVRLNGADRPTIFMNETQLLANLTSGDVASPASMVLSVFTPAPGGGSSEFKTFTVLQAGALPIPSISQINTPGALAGSGPITVEVQGDNFGASTIVLFNGVPRPTTLVNSQLLRAQLQASDVAQPGLGAITVQNSTSLNALEATTSPEATAQSSPLSINVLLPNLNPPPGITQISPASGRGLGVVPVAQIEVTITGSNFLPESRVLWNNEPYPTQYVNGATLKLIVSAGDLAMPGVASVKVNNPAPGGGDSNVKTFTILDPIIPQRTYLPLIIK